MLSCGISERKQMNKLSVAPGQGRGGGRVKWVRGIKESTCDEHRVLYADGESLNPTPRRVLLGK